MSRPEIIPGVLGRRAALKAERIRRDTLTQLAAALRDDPDSHVRNALDALIHEVRDPDDCEGRVVDELVADIESTAHMNAPVVALSAEDVQRLAREAAVEANNGVVVALPSQREAGAA
ncbi:hypothetical protein VSR01_16635 [Actinacidiphila sp. DG2A-62]|uniref:hypothetical protein n=1 Tax=Actinacidiphila sp. DG2A-62 TaxID=3108821 RepID=UPI002DB88256|nr:hypothetical protein [Actinacidiphila sp. DG2A-62]MEC3995074.1 hypothetical protein [Actinacidiphila sp. DG2A-62]